jgi:Protein of unknown function (DUF2971)
MDSLPSTLYKYFGPDRVAVLQKCLFRYSPLGAFNDPFEGSPEVTSITTEEGVRDLLKAALPQQTRIAYAQLPSEVRDKIPLPLLEFWLSADMNSEKSMMVRVVNSQSPMLSDMVAQKVNQYLGAFCLCEISDSLLMWSHYAASHTGFVIAFDASHAYFHEKKGPEDESRHLRHVKYSKARPRATLLEFDGADLFLVKSDHWDYEREWRILRPLEEAEVVNPGSPFDIHLFKIPPSAIKTVILGARMTKDSVDVIANSIRTIGSLGHIQLQRAMLDKSHFKLCISD